MDKKKNQGGKTATTTAAEVSSKYQGVSVEQPKFEAPKEKPKN